MCFKRIKLLLSPAPDHVTWLPQVPGLPCFGYKNWAPFIWDIINLFCTTLVSSVHVCTPHTHTHSLTKILTHARRAMHINLCTKHRYLLAQIHSDTEEGGRENENCIGLKLAKTLASHLTPLCAGCKKGPMMCVVCRLHFLNLLFSYFILYFIVEQAGVEEAV